MFKVRFRVRVRVGLGLIKQDLGCDFEVIKISRLYYRFALLGLTPLSSKISGASRCV